MTRDAAIVIGTGPGIGAAVARRLSHEGLAVGVIARSRATIDGTLAGLSGPESLGRMADVTDEAALRDALDGLVERLGIPRVLVYNAALIQADTPGELSARQQLDAYAVNVVGAITAVSHLAPRMAGAGGGTVILTGGMPEPIPDVTSLSLGKAGVRALAAILAKAYEPGGIHVATVTVAGTVSPGGAFDPDEIAERYWEIHRQVPGAWDREVLYTGSE